MPARAACGAASIFSAANSAELNGFLIGMVRKISSRFNLPYDDVLDYVVNGEVQKQCGEDSAADLEMVRLNGKNYLLDQTRSLVYSYSSEPELLGRLDESSYGIMPLPEAIKPAAGRPKTSAAKKQPK